MNNRYENQQVKMLWIILPLMLALLIPRPTLAQEDSPTGPPDGMRNPSAVYCNILGYTYRIENDWGGGQFGVCELPSGATCKAWEFLAGKCGREYSACAKRGLDTRTVSDGADPFLDEYAVCVDAEGRRLQSVTQMTNLFEESGGSVGDESSAPETSAPQSEDIHVDDTLPSSFDWRDHDGSNWLTPIKSQGMCGSCWAFAAVGVTEAVLNIEANNSGLDHNLSEQYLVTDCADVGACDGGSKSGAMRFIRDDGIPDEACLPYHDGDSDGCTYDDAGCVTFLCTYSSEGQCSDYQCSDRCGNWASRLQTISGVTCLGYYPSKDTIKQALIDYGPIAVSMNMGGNAGDRIYTCSDNESTGHAVAIVGYNDAEGYWIVRNSWGNDWGYYDNGYFNVAYDNCAIQKYPYYAGDGEPPTQASNVRPDDWSGTYIDDTTPSFRWDEAYDGESDIAGYYVSAKDWTPDSNDWWTENTAFTVPDALSDGEYHFAVTSKDNAGNVNPSNTNQQGDAPYYTFVVDTHAPSSAVRALAAEQKQASFVVNWSGSDATSGISSYDVQYRQGKYGSWVTWLSYSSASSAIFQAYDGGDYYFRCRARDQAGNVESWPSGDGDTHTYVPSVKLYLPLVFRACAPSEVFYGLVTDDGDPVADVELRLRYYDGSDWSTYATAFTDSNGNYRFPNPPRLSADQRLYVRWDNGYNSDSNPDWLYKWVCWSVTSSTTDPNARRCDFDLENVDLLSPYNDVTVSLPRTFNWRRRGISSDNYEFNLADMSDNDPYWWTSQGDVGYYTLNGLPDGFVPGERYGWWMWVYGTNGYGISYYYRYVTFSNTGESLDIQAVPVSERLPKDEWEDISPPQAQSP